MSTADLSSILDSLTGVAANSEFGALPVPDCFSRVKPDQCFNCPLKDTHKVFSDIGTDAPLTKAQQETLIDYTNDAIDVVRQKQSLAQQMDMGAGGMINYSGVGILPPGNENMVREITYDLDSVTSTYVKLTVGAGDTDPTAVPYTYPNPDYVDPVTTPLEPATLTEYHPIHGRAMVRFNAPSSLRCWDGFVFKNVEVGAGYIKLFWEDPDMDMSLADTPLPSTDTDTITCTILQYPPPTNAEPWAYQRPIYPLYTKDATKTLTPTASLMTVTSGRILYGSFTATDQDGNTLALSNLVQIDQTSAGAFTTKLDLSSYSLTGITAILCAYKIESSDTTGVVASGQSKCKHCIEDPTGSWGMDGNFFCAKRAELKADGATGTAILGDFCDECYQYGVCDYFEEDSPTNPWAAYEQLLVSHPYMASTPAGTSTTTITRIGVPSLMSLAQHLMEPQSGQHTTRSYGYAGGGWATALREVSGGGYARMDGLQSLRYGPVGETPDFTDTNTWPDEGPGANNITNRKGEYWTSNTSIYTELMQVSSRDIDVHPYRFGVSGASGNVGKRQRFRTEDIWIPQIGTDTSATRNGHTITRGYWDSHFETCSPGSETYRIKIQLGTPYWQKYAGTVTTVTVRACNFYGATYGSIVELYLEHKTVSVSIDIEDPSDPPNRMEVSKSWKQGGTNVIAPEYFRPWNYDCDLSFHGPGQGYVRAGHVIVADGHKLWITSATPMASASYLGSWDPSETTQLAGSGEQDYYDGNVSISGSSGLLLPNGHATWANRLDRIVIDDPNLVIRHLAPSAGDTFSIRNDGFILEGAAIKTLTAGSGDSPAAVSGATMLGASGEIYLPNDITDPNTCVLIEDAVRADRIMMPSVREDAAFTATFGRMMRE